MSFKEWIFSSYDNPSIKGQWGLLHISVMILIALLVVGITLLLRGKDQQKKRVVLFVFAGLILFFELTRRIIFFVKSDNFSAHEVMRALLPRPWCAISCWMVMIATIVNKKFFYNFTSITSILCALIFFAYPGVGFNNKYILFENLYSIATHSLFLTTAILFITLKFTDFKFNTMWKELICLGGVYGYGAIETWVLKIEEDPLYYLPGNDIIEIFGMKYGLFIVLYFLFIAIFWLSFYLIQNRKSLKDMLKSKK
jgi:uncharacterized membrane protein YwaF